MKILSNRKMLASATLLICVALQAHAQAPDRDLPDGVREGHHMPKLGRFEKASKVIGTEVKNEQGERLGKVKDLAVDLENGRIVEVILAAGGHLGIGEEIVAVPPSLFRPDESDKTLRLDASPDKLKTAPRFDYSKWEMSVENGNVQAAYQHFGTEAYFGTDQNAPRHSKYQRLGYVTRASTLLGAAARNQQDEKLGKVENLMLDLPAGRIAEVIIGTGGFLGLDEEYSVIAPTALHFDPERKTVRLDTTKESLLGAPHFRSSDWPDVNRPEYVTGVYEYYHVEPYYSTNNADNTALNMRDRANTTLTPFDQGGSPADRAITAQIRKDIIANGQLSVNARNVKVITVNGRVTLRGPVDSEQERQLLGEIATRNANGAKVDNELEVKVVPVKTGSDN